MPPLDSKIDDLYKEGLSSFVAAREALAKTLEGDDAKRVKRLAKPTVVPWAVNQLYWHARAVYDRLVSTGQKVRAAQIDALKGRANDVRRATDSHRKAMSDAVAEALRLASAAGAHPGADDLTKTLEAISLAREPLQEPGRLTKPLRPAGFEALAGVPVKGANRPAPAQQPRAAAVRPPSPLKLVEQKTSADRKADLKRVAEDRQKQRRIERAAASVARAKVVEARARADWEHAKQALAAAELTLSTLQ